MTKAIDLSRSAATRVMLASAVWASLSLLLPPATTHAATADGFDLQPNTPVILRNMGFAPNSAELTPIGIATLTPLADYIRQRPQLCLEINGHADSSGERDRNRVLSLERAKVVGEYLVRVGKLRADCVFAKGVGDSRPLADNATPEGRAENRRLEVQLLTEHGLPPVRVATLAKVLRQVTVRSPWDLDWRTALSGRPLYEFARVATGPQSQATIAYLDANTLQLGENALAIVYRQVERPLGDSRRDVDVELMRGGLENKLSAMKGPLVVKTPSSRLELQGKQQKVFVDPKDRSVVSVHSGAATVSAANPSAATAAVAVNEGFGTQVLPGAAPEAPRALPAAPRFVDGPKQAGDAAACEIRVAAVTGRARLEVSRDGELLRTLDSDELPVSERAADGGLRFKLALEPGTYALEATAIDAIDLESDAAQAELVVHAAAASRPTPPATPEEQAAPAGDDKDAATAPIADAAITPPPAAPSGAAAAPEALSLWRLHVALVPGVSALNPNVSAGVGGEVGASYLADPNASLQFTLGAGGMGAAGVQTTRPAPFAILDAGLRIHQRRAIATPSIYVDARFGIFAWLTPLWPGRAVARSLVAPAPALELGLVVFDDLKTSVEVGVRARLIIDKLSETAGASSWLQLGVVMGWSYR